MERYIPKQKGRVFKITLFVIVTVLIIISIRYKLHKKAINYIFPGKSNSANFQAADTGGVSIGRLKSLQSYNIKNYPEGSVKTIKLERWIAIIRENVKLYYNSPGELIFFNRIYDIKPRWCYIVGDILLTKKDGKHYLVADLRTPDVVTFKFKKIDQIFRANSPTLANINVSAKFYGIKNSDGPAVFTLKTPVTLKHDSQQPSKRIWIEVEIEKINGYKFVIVELEGIKYFVFK
jgi:hypothetical protein